ncbi:MAG: RNA polymerase sigma factor [Bacteroidota bacterium]
MTQTDAKKIENTVKQERGKLLSFIRKRVSNTEDAEDILQDVFSQFVTGFEAIQSLEKATSWLFSVARNKIIDRYRVKGREPQKMDIDNRSDEDEGSLNLSDIIPDFTNAPDEIYSRSLIGEMVDEALDELPDEQQEVFIMHEFENRSFKEISELTQTTVNTAISRKRYAVLHLRKRLKELYEEL